MDTDMQINVMALESKIKKIMCGTSLYYLHITCSILIMNCLCKIDMLLFSSNRYVVKKHNIFCNFIVVKWDGNHRIFLINQTRYQKSHKKK